MSVTLNRTLAELDRHQAEWAPVTEVPATASTPDLLLAWLERRLGQWDARLTAAAELAASVEQELAERSVAAERWHEVFVRWQNLINKEGTVPSTSAE
jgi:hypothetical protein